MGWIGGSRTTQTQTQTPQIPPWIQDNVQGNLALAGQLADRPFEAYGGPRVAGLNGMQQQARGLAQGNVGSWRPGLTMAQGATQAGMGGPTLLGRGPFGAPQFRGADYADAYRDPYEDDVVRQTLADLQRSGAQEQNQLALSQAGSGGYGGSRAGIQAAELTRNLFDRQGAAAGQLRSQGFQMRQQFGQQDAGRDFQTQDANARNMEAYYGRMLQGGQQIAGLTQQGSDLGQRDAQTLNMLGEQERGLTQQGMDADYEEFLRRLQWQDRPLNLRLAAQGQSPLQMFAGSTTTGTQRNPTDWGALLQSGASIASMFAMSDIRLKTDIEDTGRTTERGTPLFRWRYVTGGPVHEGPIAQLSPPDAVEIGPNGFLMVDLGRV